MTVPPALSFIQPSKPIPSVNVGYQFGFLRCFFGFVLGMIAYGVYKDGLWRVFLGKGEVFLLFAACLFACMHFGVWDVISVCFFPLMILSAAHGSRRMNAFFARNMMQQIGNWSFSIYMVHQPLMFTILSIMSFANRNKSGPPPNPSMLAGWIVCVVFIALTLVVSSLTYRFIEVPARKMINRKFTSVKSNPHRKPASET